MRDDVPTDQVGRMLTQMGVIADISRAPCQGGPWTSAQSTRGRGTGLATSARAFLKLQRLSHVAIDLPHAARLRQPAPR
jgi:hypothetical protein